MKVPLVDLRAAFLPVKDRVFREFETILEGMQLFQGPNVRAFEEEFAAYCESPHGIGVGNGTEALFAALVACGVGPGDVEEAARLLAAQTGGNPFFLSQILRADAETAAPGLAAAVRARRQRAAAA